MASVCYESQCNRSYDHLKQCWFLGLPSLYLDADWMFCSRRFFYSDNYRFWQSFVFLVFLQDCLRINAGPVCIFVVLLSGPRAELFVPTVKANELLQHRDVSLQKAGERGEAHE